VEFRFTGTFGCGRNRDPDRAAVCLAVSLKKNNPFRRCCFGRPIVRSGNANVRGGKRLAAFAQLAVAARRFFALIVSALLDPLWSGQNKKIASDRVDRRLTRRACRPAAGERENEPDGPNRFPMVFRWQPRRGNHAFPPEAIEAAVIVFVELRGRPMRLRW